MEKLNNGFKDYYYVDSDYRIYNAKTKKHLKPDSQNSYTLVMESGKPKHISNNTLLKLVFGDTFVLQDVESLPNEQWRRIYDSQYFVSNLGRIKSNILLTAKIINPETSNGYERVCINLGYGNKHLLVHKLVAIAFLDTPNQAFMEIHHINNDKLCNRADNLVFLTREEHRKIHRELAKRENEDV